MRPLPETRTAPGRAHGPVAVAGLLLVYAAVAAVYLRATWAGYADHLVGGHGDPVFNLYVLKWGAHQLRLGLPDLWDANFFYPARGALAFSDHLIGPALQLLLLLDLRLVPNAIAGYNLLLASSFVLCGATTAWVLRESGRSWTAAVLGGAMYAFAPMRWAHLIHLQVLLAQWLPITLWCWDRLLAEPGWKRAAAFLPFYLLHLAGGSYLAYMIHLPMLALLVSRAAAAAARPDAARPDAPRPDAPRPDAPRPDAPRPDAPRPGLASWRGLRVLAAVALPAAAAAWLVFAPYVEAARRYGLARSAREAMLYAATLPSYLAPAESNLYAGWWHRLADPLHFAPSWDESRLFAGFLPTAFCAAGLIAFWRRYRAPAAPPARPLPVWQRAGLAALAAVAALAFLDGDRLTLRANTEPGAYTVPALVLALAAGLWLLARRRWGGNWVLRFGEMDPWERGIALAGLASFLLSFPIVFVPLMDVVPGLGGLRAPGRFYAVTSLAIVVFAAKGLDAWLPAGGGRRRALAAALALALAVELAPAALPTRPLRAEPDFPPVYQYLRAARPAGGVLELPRLKPERETLYMYYSTLHWQPIANGYSGYFPATDRELRHRLPGALPDDKGFRLLRQRGITRLVVHQAGPEACEIRRQLPDWEDRYLGREVQEVAADDADIVYRLLDAPATSGAAAAPAAPAVARLPAPPGPGPVRPFH